MPQRDLYHNLVVNALQNEGWIITDDPLCLTYGGRNVYADLGAEQPIAAEKAGRRIAIEIKSFVGESDIHEPELSVGQYRMYRNILAELQPERTLYLAVPDFAYDGIFQEPLGQMMLRREELRLLVFDHRQERIRQWIP